MIDATWIRQRIPWIGVCAVMLAACQVSDSVLDAREKPLPERQLPLIDIGTLSIERVRVINLGTDSAGFVNSITDLAVVDSVLYVLDGMSKEVKVYDRSTGRLKGRFGGMGPGPGEFRDPMAIAATLDTVYVIDPTMGPFVAVFTSAGDFVEERELEIPGNPTDFVLSSGGFVVLTPFAPEQRSGDHHIAHRLARDGTWVGSGCASDGRYAASEATGGLLARMRYSFVTATPDRIACTQPVSPAIQLVEGNGPVLNYVPPFYRPPTDRPLEGISQAAMFEFLSTWTTHVQAYVWETSFLSIYSTYDTDTKQVTYSVFRCGLAGEEVTNCDVLHGLGNVVAVPTPDSLFVEEIDDANASAVIVVLAITS